MITSLLPSSDPDPDPPALTAPKYLFPTRPEKPSLTPFPVADFVQELYLKELKAYKTPAVKDSDATGHVQTFSLPKAPKSPEESDLASSLKEYESMAVEVEGQDTSAQAAGAAAPVLDDWLVDEEDEAEASRPVAGATH